MPAKRSVRIRTAVTLAALGAAAALGAVLASPACAAPAVLPLPLPAAGAESLVTEGVTIEGPLINNLTLPTSK